MELSTALPQVQEDDCKYSFSEESEDDDDDSYIEIALDDAPPSSSECQIINLDSNSTSVDAECDDDDDEDCHELRISISSTINPIPLIHNSHTSSMDSPQTHASAPSLLSSPSSSDLLTKTFPEKYCRSAEYSPTARPLQLHTPPKPRLFSSSVNRLFNLRVRFSDNHPRQNPMLQNTIPSISTYNTRKQPSMGTKATDGGGMMKLLIKFRATKIRTLIASLVKPSKGKSKSKMKILQCYSNPSDGNGGDNEEGIRRSSDSGSEVNSSESSFRRNRSRRGGGGGVVEIDLGALNLRGIFNMAGKGSSKRTSNWSTSASPLHQGFSLYSTSTDNSIQAAIAYCKTSSDFSF